MAAVEITISGVLYDKLNRTTQQVVLVGDASLTGIGIGGGPIIPPGSPPGIWGPTDPRPTPPIYIPPEPPTQPPIGTPDDDGFIKPPTGNGPSWAYHQTYGWLLDPGGTLAGPKR